MNNTGDKLGMTPEDTDTVWKRHIKTQPTWNICAVFWKMVWDP